MQTKRGTSTLVVVLALVALVLIYPLLRTLGKSVPIHQVYRLLVAVGVILTVVLIIVWLNSIIFYGFLPTAETNILLETQKNFTTIIGTAFASLVAFYFGTRATQEGNGNGGPPKGTLEVLNVSPIEHSEGVETDAQVFATFSATVRTTTINSESFFIKDDKDKKTLPVKYTPKDNNTTIELAPVDTFNPGTKYTVTIKKSIMDISGATMATDKVWSFKTKQ